MLTLEYVQDGRLVVETYESALDLHAAGLGAKENGAGGFSVRIGGNEHE